MQKPSAIEFAPYAGKVITYHARQLSRSPGFRAAEQLDLEQDLWLDLIARMPRYDPAKASVNTFIARIVENKCVSMVRHRRAAKRHPGRVEASLNDHVKDCDGRVVDRHQTTPEASNTPQRHRDLERDVADVLARLSPVHGDVARLLASGTINSAAKELGISRRIVQRTTEELRAAFGDAGLRHYL